MTPSPFATEGARAFYQSRVTLLFGTQFGLGAGFFVLHNTLDILSGKLSLSQLWTLPLNFWHFGAAALSGALAAATRARELPVSALTLIEAIGSVAVLAAYDMMGVTMLGELLPHFDLVLTLVYVQFLTLRAVVVPSTARRTLLVCSLAAVPLLTVTWLLAAYAPDAWSLQRTVYAPLYVSLWCLMATVPATIASSVIYGLRQQIRQVRQLGQYTLETRIGEGGMGTVYRARHAMLRRPTAVKLLRRERSGEAALGRFEREVQLTSRLTHPNTVAIYDYGRTADGIFYYAMEYLDGVDLQRLVELDGPQGPARSVHVLRQVCGALREAHGLGLVHRDIKPANIILCERGGVPDVAKVVDFGLVKSLSSAELDPELTAANTIIGTPHFLAPEAIRGPDQADPRSDLYAVGAVGYFLLTGAPVFDGLSAIEICGQHLHATPVPPSQRVAQPIPPALEALLLRCLAKDPAARPQAASELGAELLAALPGGWTEAEAAACWQRLRISNPELAASHAHFSPTLVEIDMQRRGRSR